MLYNKRKSLGQIGRLHDHYLAERFKSKETTKRAPNEQVQHDLSNSIRAVCSFIDNGEDPFIADNMMHPDSWF